MSAASSLERIVYNVKCNGGTEYPPISKEEFTYMEIEASRYECYVMCFPFFRRVKGKVYKDIYIWDVLLSHNYERFVMEVGYALEEEQERRFLHILSDNICFDEELLLRLVDTIKKEYAEYNLIQYADKRHILLHIYYSMHRAGVYEILYKAHLECLAVGLKDTIEEYNLLGASPQEIFEVPIGMLRALNTSVGVRVLSTPESRKMAKKVYLAFHNYIHGSYINKYQWLYLKEQMLCNGSIDRKRLNYLGEMTSDSQYYSYLHYLDYKYAVDEYYAILPKYPRIVDLDWSIELCDKIEWYIVRVPMSIEELLLEAASQQNCLHSYILDIIYGDSIILFMREKNYPDKSLVTIQVKRNTICQAYAFCNINPNKKQSKFLIEFAEVKRLAFEPEVEEMLFDEGAYN